MDQHKEDGGWPFHSYFETHLKSQKKYLSIYLGFKRITKNPNNKSHKIKTSLNSHCVLENAVIQNSLLLYRYLLYHITQLANKDVYGIINTIYYSIYKNIDIYSIRIDLITSNYFNLCWLISTLWIIQPHFIHLPVCFPSPYLTKLATNGDPLI